jgi:hypothetical protein
MSRRPALPPLQRTDIAAMAALTTQMERSVAETLALYPTRRRPATARMQVLLPPVASATTSDTPTSNEIIEPADWFW